MNHFWDKGSVSRMMSDVRILNRKGAARFAVGIEEGIQAFLGQRRVGKL